ncbi:serine/arginine repetitive matrix protein 2 [Streptomyces sp. NPDC099050]|uniref:serine/arginine repetitive matrix protein 2 n=1 Tax=Streptomyces sp. NPDC099050 TaxID=3366100 RepID=UPI0038241E79
MYPVPPPSQPARAAGRWLTPTTAAVAVAALALGAAGVWFVARDTGERPPQAGPAASSVAPGDEATAEPSATDTGSPSPTATATATSTGSPTPGPTGSDPAHETVRDAKGFTIAVPAGWLREEAAAGVFYRSPDRAALIQVFQVSEPELTPLAAVRGASAYLRAQTTGYREISVGPAPDAPGAGELVYEYDNAESHGRRRGVERVFVAEDGKKWAVLTAGPAPDWTLTQTHHRAALTAFRPTGG